MIERDKNIDTISERKKEYRKHHIYKMTTRKYYEARLIKTRSN